MSLPEFDTLLRQHPDEIREIVDLQRVIVTSLRADRHARFDLPLVLHHMKDATPSQAKRLLVELVRVEALQPLLFWECPNGNGPIFESENIADFPDHIVCDRCGAAHWFDTANVEVGFIATSHLQEEVASRDDREQLLERDIGA